MRLLIIEQPLNNRGDESAHRGLIKTLLNNYKNLTIDILFLGRTQQEIDFFKVNSPQVNYINIEDKSKYFTPMRIIKYSTMFRIPSIVFIFPFARKLIRVYKKADYIMCAPGGINLGGFQDWRHLGLLKIVIKLNKPLIYFARSIGPFSNENYLSSLFSKESINLLKKTVYLSLRDNSSQKYADTYNIKYIKTIDSAFLDNTYVNIPENIMEEIGSNYIVIVPNSLTWHNSFKNLPYEFVKSFWIKLINRLMDIYPQYKIVMLPQTIGYSKYLQDGYIYFNEIKTVSNNPNMIYILEEKYGSDIQQSIIKGAKFLIGARYHSIIFSINQGTPFISLSYEHKMTGVLNMLKLQDYEINLRKILNDIYENASEIDNFIKQLINLTKSLPANIDYKKSAYDIAIKAFYELDNIINK